MAEKPAFVTVRKSLADLAGADYVDLVASARSRLTGVSVGELRRRGRERIDFFPRRVRRRLAALLSEVGKVVTRPVRRSPAGAGPRSFNLASRPGQAPLAGWGYYRVGEDGRLRFLLKSEHYHVPLGHGFPGYRLLEVARALGIPNATHNNTRGWITRLLEEELVRAANGLGPDDDAGLAGIIRSERPGRLNRVLNLETGSLACEAAIKMMLARFYRVQQGDPAPKYSGRTPVFVVLGDDEGSASANYHGTTVLAQVLRGMWPGLTRDMDRRGVLKIAAVRPNDTAGLEKLFETWDRPPHKIAGLLHELVMMNYGGRLLAKGFVRQMYRLCRQHDAPVLCDEIQTCAWSPDLFMFREYGIRPALVAVGKGLPGGEYAASRLIFEARMDCLPQFGALVTNGQEEIASLAYLVTLCWVRANAAAIAAVGERYEAALRRLAGRFPSLLSSIEGRRHLSGLCFHDLDKAKAFARRMVEAGLDISIQTYKADAPPVALTKLPLIADATVIEMVMDRMTQALETL
jgi:acetylornithine/succinyldiaminopimelate/putrescine aminotransferase